MDTAVIAMRLRKLDGYLRSLRQLQNVTLAELDDFDAFAGEIAARFLAGDASA